MPRPRRLWDQNFGVSTLWSNPPLTTCSLPLICPLPHSMSSQEVECQVICRTPFPLTRICLVLAVLPQTTSIPLVWEKAIYHLLHPLPYH